MAAFSDTTIKANFSALIDDGDISRSGACEYYFVAGKLNPTGVDIEGNGLPVIDWTSKPPSAWPAETAYAVRPGSLLILRTRERIKMPADLCGLWYQTDGLSRQGLMLINMSIVPPGYQGPLTCTFVNFGRNTIHIKPDTLISKVFFLPLDHAAQRQSKVRDEREYDSKLADLARESPSSFLQISDHTKELQTLIDTGKRELVLASEAAGEKFSQEAKAAGDQYRTELERDAVKAVWKAAPWAALAILLLAGGQWLATSLLTANVEKVAKERADQIEANINQQLATVGGKPVIVYSGSTETKVLMDRIKALEAEVTKLQAKKK
ncbi:MAG: hypothetical protein ABI728_04535 [Betaproteobacteria bacterium]